MLDIVMVLTVGLLLAGITGIVRWSERVTESGRDEQ